MLDSLLGFTAGVMLAATSFSLLVPALERGTVTEVLVGFAGGSGFIALLDARIPHVHVIVDELIPESHGHGNELGASLALLIGFALMLTLDNAL